jgi:pimeloyl-ACP methyl ester carboxylesterase
MNDLPTDHTTGTLKVPGARLSYEVRGRGPLVALVASPMPAAAFAPLADLLAPEYTVLTADPRGIQRSSVDDPDGDCTPEMRADDLSRLLAHLDAGPAVVLGSSGGAATVLALAQTHPEQVHTVIAHEPPMDELLDDREQRRTVTEDIIATYRSQGRAAAWRIFLADANIQLPDEMFSAMFAGPLDDQEAADEDHFFLHELLHTNTWAPDINTLRNTPARFVVGIGTESLGQSCDRISRALANALDVEPIMFPGGHTGFVEYHAAFAARLQAVLQDADHPLR